MSHTAPESGAPCARRVPPLEGRASGASEAGVLGTTKEVLGSIDFLDFDWDFLGFPILVL